MFTLNKLPLNYTSNIAMIEHTGLERRLLDLGLVSGTPITALFRSPLGDPTAYEFRGSIIAIREDEAKKILIKDKIVNTKISV